MQIMASPAGKRKKIVSTGKVFCTEVLFNNKRKESNGGGDEPLVHVSPQLVGSFPEKCMKIESGCAGALRAEKSNIKPAGRGETAQAHAQGANRKVKATPTDGACSKLKQKGEVGKSSSEKGKQKAVWSKHLEHLLVSLMRVHYDHARLSGQEGSAKLRISREADYWKYLLNGLQLSGEVEQEMTKSKVYEKVKRMKVKYYALQKQLKEKRELQFKNPHQEKLYQVWKIIWGTGTGAEPTGPIAVPQTVADLDLDEESLSNLGVNSSSKETAGEAARVEMSQCKVQESSSKEGEEAVSLRRKTAGIDKVNATGKAGAASTTVMSKPRLQCTPVHLKGTKRGGDVHNGDDPEDSKTLARIFLERSTKIVALQERPRGTTRPYSLLVQTMLEGLVSLYFEVFLSHWPQFSKLNHGHPDDVEQACAKLARVYISGWINDLYYCLRAVVKSTDPVLFRSHFIMENYLASDDYDEFLVILNAMIRPTTLFHTSEESTAIPVFDDSMISPLSVMSSDFNEPLHRAITGAMMKSKEFRMGKLNVGITDGKPIWLLDWWRMDTAHTWIPFEGNFSLDDVAVAYIVGVPMTDINGPCDADIPKKLPRDYIHGITHDTDLRRLTARKFTGAVEERRITRVKRLSVKGSQWRFQDDSFPRDTSLRDDTVQRPFSDGGAGAGEASTSKKGKAKKRYRIDADTRCEVYDSLIRNNLLEEREFGIVEDFVYHAQVIRGVELQSRYRALSYFVLTAKGESK